MTQTRQERLVIKTARAFAPADVMLSLVQGGKHPALVLSTGARQVKMPFACSPRSDDQCLVNYTRQKVRRALLQLAA